MPTLTDLDVEFVSLVDRAAVRDPVQQSEPMRFLVWKRDERDPNNPQEESMTPEEKAALDKAQADLTAATEAITAKTEALTASQQTIETLKAEIAELKKAAGDAGVIPVTEAIDKAELPEPVRAALEKAETDRAAALAKAEEAEQIAKAERDARLTREFVTKAETFKALPVKADEFGPVLKAASESLSAEHYSALEQVLKAADGSLAETDLFKEQGRSRPADQPDSAVAAAKSAAAEIRKNDSSLSEAQAMQKAFADDPDLAARYQAEMRAR